MSDSQSNSQPAPPPNRNILDLLLANKITFLATLTRLATVICTILYVLPWYTGSQNWYQKALIAYAASSSLRLHQRCPRFQLNAEFLQQLASEDSAHYLIFSIIFIFSAPFTLVLLPISILALINIINFAIDRLLNAELQNHVVTRKLIDFKQANYSHMFQLIALSEITLFPICIVGVLTGSCPLITPFTYSRFLSYRYASRRVYHTRLMFTTLRNTLEQLIVMPQCPTVVANIVRQMIALVSRFAPEVRVSQ